MGLVYLEYRSRRSGVELALYHQILAKRTGGWTEAYPDDVVVLNVGRSWRIGPEPEYLKAYYSPRHGLERLSDWARIWRSGEVAVLEAQTRLTGRIDAAGCFVPLMEPVIAEEGPYYVEFFDSDGVGAREAVAEFYRERAATHRGLGLHLVIDRIGKLGPDPRGVAVWNIGDYRNVEQIASELDGVDQPVRLVNCGLYENLGAEIL